MHTSSREVLVLLGSSILIADSDPDDGRKLFQHLGRSRSQGGKEGSTLLAVDCQQGQLHVA